MKIKCIYKGYDMYTEGKWGVYAKEEVGTDYAIILFI